MAKPRRRIVAPLDTRRHQRSLGSNDPGPARSAAAAQQTNQVLDRTLTRDRRGRLGIQPARAVADLSADATLQDVIARFNEMLASDRAAGFKEGGR